MAGLATATVSVRAHRNLCGSQVAEYPSYLYWKNLDAANKPREDRTGRQVPGPLPDMSIVTRPSLRFHRQLDLAGTIGDMEIGEMMFAREHSLADEMAPSRVGYRWGRCTLLRASGLLRAVRQHGHAMSGVFTGQPNRFRETFGSKVLISN